MRARYGLDKLDVENGRIEVSAKELRSQNVVSACGFSSSRVGEAVFYSDCRAVAGNARHGCSYCGVEAHGGASLRLS